MSLDELAKNVAYLVILAFPSLLVSVKMVLEIIRWFKGDQGRISVADGISEERLKTLIEKQAEIKDILERILANGGTNAERMTHIGTQIDFLVQNWRQRGR
jgi:hypothetical protein